MPRNQPWSREETLLAFALYLRLPTRLHHSKNAEVIELAERIGRSPGAVSFKLGNIKSCDPMRTGTGLPNASKLDRQMWDEYAERGDALVEEAMRVTLSEDPGTMDLEYMGHELPVGREREAIAAVRANQAYFRNALMENYCGRCCLTGISTEGLLVATHIKPWSESDPVTERLSPENGLLLNALHDCAFERGLITLDRDLRVMVSPTVPRYPVETSYLWKYEGMRIETPGPYKPRPEFIEYHNDVVFKR